MIAKLTGRIDTLGEHFLILDCNGVGYLVAASTKTLSRLGSPGSAVSVLIETHVGEDHIRLYGFADSGERDWFRLLTTVQGVGARVALAILSVLDADALTLAIAAQDKTALSRADGVGPKLALRLVTELKDKVATLGFTVSETAAIPKQSSPANAAAQNINAQADAVSALVNLGYGRSEAMTAIARAANDSNDATRKDVASLIRAGLKALSS